MNDNLVKELAQEKLTPMHEALLSKCRDLLDMSRAHVSQNYSEWDCMQDAYDAERDVDIKDLKAAAVGAPGKVVVPLTHSQIQTFVAFMFMLYHQRQEFFELEPSGAEDFKIREYVQKALKNDLAHNNFSLRLFQFLLDIGRFGVGVFKTSWVIETVTLLTEAAVNEFQGLKTGADQAYTEYTAFEGNKILNISPYKFFYDTRLPLTRFQEGEFCASESEMQYHELRALEHSKDVAGIEHIGPFDERARKAHAHSRFSRVDPTKANSDENICITEIQVKLVPDQFELTDKTKLGDTSKPITFLVWMANDNRIIRLEPLNYYHGKFTYDVAQIAPDMHKDLSKSLAAQVEPLQKITDWFFNSRIESVHRTLGNQLVCDPSVVDMGSVKNNSRVITLKQGAPRIGIDRFVKPLPVMDSTTNHLDSAFTVAGMADQVTGINQTAQGRFHSGRRSATEARGAISGSNSRLTLYGSLIWEGGLSPMGAKLAVNARQSMSVDTMRILVGQEFDQAVYDAFKSDVINLVRKADLFIFDGTLPSEKQYAAQSLQELLSIIMSDPLAAQQLKIDPTKLVEEIYYLRGIRNMTRFEPELNPASPNALMQLIQQMSTASDAPTQPTT